MRSLLEEQVRHLESTLDERLVGVRANFSEPSVEVITVLLPYCGISLEWDLYLDRHDNTAVPDVMPLPPVIVDSDWVEDVIDEQRMMWDWYSWCRLDRLKSLRNWDISRKDCLSSLVLDIREAFMQYNLAKIDQCSGFKGTVVGIDTFGGDSRSQMLYMSPTAAGVTQALLVLPVTEAEPSKSDILLDGASTSSSYGVDARFLQALARIRVYIRATASNNFPDVKVSVPEELCATSALNELRSPAWEGEGIPLQDRISELHDVIVKRREQRRLFVSSLRARRSLIEYDSTDYAHAHVYVKFKENQASTGRGIQVSRILRFDIGGDFPASPPRMTLLDPLSNYRQSLAGDGARYSPRWDMDRVVLELMEYVCRSIFNKPADDID